MAAAPPFVSTDLRWTRRNGPRLVIGISFGAVFGMMLLSYTAFQVSDRISQCVDCSGLASLLAGRQDEERKHGRRHGGAATSLVSLSNKEVVL